MQALETEGSLRFAVYTKQFIPKLPLDSYKVAACKGMMSKSLDIWPLLTEFRGQVRVMC